MRLDSVELAQLVYLVAFDLQRFDLRYSLGTDHPGVGWSPRTLPQMRDKALPGPDGIGTSAPLVRTGMVAPGGRRPDRGRLYRRVQAASRRIQVRGT